MAGLTVLAAVLGLVLAAAPSASLAGQGRAGPYWERCGDNPDFGSGIYALKTHHVDCGVAMVVAKHYYKKGDHSLGDWTCRSNQAGETLYRPVCKSGFPGQLLKYVTVVAPGVEQHPHPGPN